MEESPHDPYGPDRYGVVGFPVAHSKSPFIHGMFARQTAQNMEYRLYEVPPVAFRTEVARFFAEGGSGLNVTVPHKVAAAAAWEVIASRGGNSVIGSMFRARAGTPKQNIADKSKSPANIAGL